LLDLSGNGRLDVVTFDGPTPGYLERTAAGGWQPWRTFDALPTVNLSGPDARFVDLDGDGHADLLVGTGHVTVGALNDAGAAWVIPGASCDASATSYGNGHAGSSGVPQLVASAAPVLGTDFDLTIGNSSGGSTTGLLLLGTTAVQIPTTLGGDLLVGISIVVPLVFPTAQDLVLAESLPFDALFAGEHVYLQALELDAGASRGVAFTAGLDLLLGGLTW